MNGMQWGRAASIAAGGVALIASGLAFSEPALAMMGALASLTLLLLGQGCRTLPHPVFADGAYGPACGFCPRSVFLRDRGTGSAGEGATDPAAKNGRRNREDATSDPEDEADHPAALSYEEFTARVEEAAETEEISFLPPYASGSGETSREDAGAVSEPWDIEDDDEPDAAKRPSSQSKMPMPRHFALGTVAVIRKLLEPVDVERILAEQRRYPRLRFGDIAVQLGVLNETQVQELLLAQQQGVFTDEEIRDARDRLRAFRNQAGTAGNR